VTSGDVYCTVSSDELLAFRMSLLVLPVTVSILFVSRLPGFITASVVCAAISISHGISRCFGSYTDVYYYIAALLVRS